MTEKRSAARMAAAATALGVALVGCEVHTSREDPRPSKSETSETTGPTESPSPKGPGSSGKLPWGDGGEPAAAGKKVGTSGSGCELPLTFTAAKGWTSEAVKPDADFVKAGLTPVCEVDAKPAGNIGYLRVYTGKKHDSPREALSAYVKEKHPKSVKHRSTKAGSTTAAEVSFVSRVVIDGEELDSKPELAYAVSTDEGVAVVSLGAMDAEEHEEMLPAYLLAKDTLRVGQG